MMRLSGLWPLANVVLILGCNQSTHRGVPLGLISDKRDAEPGIEAGEPQLDARAEMHNDPPGPITHVGSDGGRPAPSAAIGNDASHARDGASELQPTPRETARDAATDAEVGLDATEASARDAESGTPETDAWASAGFLDAAADGGLPSDAGSPVLTSLEVTGARTSLFPAFDPNRSRYSIIAGPNSSVLSVTVAATGIANVRLNGVVVVNGEATELSSIVPGTQLTITVGDEPNSTSYVVEYLPPNFPELFVEYPNPGATDEPVYTNLAMNAGQFIVKLDQAGVPLFYKEEATRVYDFKKHPDGTLSYAVRLSTTEEGSIEVLLDAEYQEINRVSAVGLTDTDEHDFLILPSGNHVFLSYEPAIHDLTAYGLSATEPVIDSIFQEVSTDQQVLFQWNTWGHVQYDQSQYAFKQEDYAHANSIAVDYDDNWLLSSRGFSQVLKIDRSTGDVIWRLGGLASDFTFINDPYNGICGQHAASRLENGHILIFDNARDCLPEIFGSRPSRSRAVEYALDEGNMTAELVWSYERDGILAYSQGSAQRMSNGNTMIGWGSGPNVLATEVTDSGDVVYELTGRTEDNTRLGCYRARKFPE